MSRARFLAGRSGGAVGSRRPHADGKSCEGPRVLPGEHRARLGRWDTSRWSPAASGASPQSPWPAEMQETQRLYSASSPGSSSASPRTLSPGEKEELDAAIAQAREALGNDAFDAAWAEGGGLSLDQAVELSLSRHGVTGGRPRHDLSRLPSGGRRPSGSARAAVKGHSRTLGHVGHTPLEAELTTQKAGRRPQKARRACGTPRCP